ncbi:hypothetical protein Y032_0430g1314 [Ancylostoma ceylanicum]|uniref:Uncharacterized protein n=1 Tax=Ancylostoma ceylanicum TaxID=53326 RepID=A0A016X0K8_9BILA|nr:hypothetical protein Y032_0430g1314 [Ancylostoma ceylanicum]
MDVTGSHILSHNLCWIACWHENVSEVNSRDVAVKYATGHKLRAHFTSEMCVCFVVKAFESTGISYLY